MADFLIRDLDEDVMKKLKARAEKHRRSMQAEIKDILTQSAGRLSKAESIELLQRLRAETAGRPHRGSVVDDIREDRDSR